jgi:hypothetical protein
MAPTYYTKDKAVLPLAKALSASLTPAKYTTPIINEPGAS